MGSLIVVTVLVIAFVIFRLLRIHKPITRMVIGLAVGTFGFLLAWIHLLGFHQLYLRKGRVRAGEPPIRA
jgi:hypothetical protein